MHPYLTIATKAARSAAKILLAGLERLDAVHITEKDRNNLVTNIDYKMEEILIQTIQQNYPDHAILAEESGFIPGKQPGDHLWIIDPLDGTTNFIHGYPYVCITLAYQYQNKTEIALTYNPLLEELFLAENGRGARLNQKRIRTSQRTTPEGALMGLSPPRRTTDVTKARLIQRCIDEFSPEVAGFRASGSAALALAHVACGRLDAYIESDLAPWDCCAGALLIQEAGGMTSNFNHQHDFSSKKCDIIAGAPDLHAYIVKQFKRPL